MTTADLIARARSAAGRGTKYRPGAGGFNSRTVMPSWDGECESKYGLCE